MRVVYAAAARKALRSVPVRDREALHRKLEIFAETGVGDVVKLVNRDYLRLRHGDWRAIFFIENDMIVFEIAHRREVYR